jgi:hypothetical protein
VGVWYGGGLFLDKQAVWLHGTVQESLPRSRDLPIKFVVGDGAGGSEDGIYYKLLERDGWVMVQQGV